MIFDNKQIIITGGTGSLGKTLTKRILSGVHGTPSKLIIFSRDEAKQHYMRLDYLNKLNATDEIIYSNFNRLIEFRIGDVRDYDSIYSAMQGCNIIINAAALKQVPSCEYFVEESVKTNIIGACNIVRAIENGIKADVVVGISTDKACKPVNVMGMTKAIQEKIFLSANIKCPNTRFVCVRYGNVLASRGSVIPLFHEQIKNGGPVTITCKNMTRFLLSLEEAVDIIVDVIRLGKHGDTFIPRINAVNVQDLAIALIDGRKIEIKEMGIRPGEKIHEILISEEEKYITKIHSSGKFFIISSLLPEISIFKGTHLESEYSSNEKNMSIDEIKKLLKDKKLTIEDSNLSNNEEMLR